MSVMLTLARHCPDMIEESGKILFHAPTIVATGNFIIS